MRGSKELRKEQAGKFLPAKLSFWMLWIFQQWIRFDLLLHNPLRVDPADIETLRKLGMAGGVILTPNHADETDFKVCVELSRLSRIPLFYMMNREAFSECSGIAGWFLQRLGAFSVERGGKTNESKRYAVDILKEHGKILVIFPEGEIYYLNDRLQAFKSGAVEIAMTALLEVRSHDPDWQARILPMAIKYCYRAPLAPLMDRRLKRIEKHLSRSVRSSRIQMRLALILAELLHREEVARKLRPGSARLEDLNQRVFDLRQSVLQQLEEKYVMRSKLNRAAVMDRIWQLSSQLRDMLRVRRPDRKWREQLREDLQTLKRLAEMGSWQPSYVDVSASQERLAETIMKLERDVFKIKRPAALAKRDAIVKLGEAIELSEFVSSYEADPHKTRHMVSEQLKEEIQHLLDGLAGVCGVGSRNLGSATNGPGT